MLGQGWTKKAFMISTRTLYSSGVGPEDIEPPTNISRLKRFDAEVTINGEGFMYWSGTA